MKMGNIGSFDPELMKRGVVGLQNASKMDEGVWNEFNNDWDRLAFESESLIAKLKNEPLDSIMTEDEIPITLSEIPNGLERQAIVKMRVNQSFFRAAILSSYNTSCCITGLSLAPLLVASHIKPWSLDKENRLNPRNGLCLNSLHDKAFDTGFITVTSDLKVKVSRSITDLVENDTLRKFFLDFQGRNIILPERFTPDPIFLEYHANEIFVG